MSVHHIRTTLLSYLKNKFLLIFLFAILVYTSYWVVALGISSVNRYFLQLYTDNWEKTGITPSEDEWQSANSFYSKAMNWYADNPSLLRSGGQLYLWKATLRKQGKDKNQALHQALGFFERAVSKQPANVDNWLSYAVTKERLKQRDGKLDAALKQVQWLGSNDSQVQLVGIQIRLMNLPNLSEQGHQQLLIALNTAARLDANGLIKVINRYNLKLFLCYRIKGIQIIDSFCGR